MVLKKKPTNPCNRLLYKGFRYQARDGARGLGDLGFARTGAKRRYSNLRAQDWARK